MTTNGLKAFNKLKDFLIQEGWNIELVDNYSAYSSKYEGSIGSYTCYFQIRPDLEQFLFYAVPEFTTPQEKLADVAEYVARVNSGMRIGNFEIDFRDGQIRFKSSVNFRDTNLTSALIGGAVSPALEALETYIPGLLNVIAGKQTPVKAINSIDYQV